MLRNPDCAIMLPKKLFKELHIIESFNDWNTKGYLIYDNTFEQIERYKAKSKVKNSEFFYFRMDGTDEIIIELTPILKAESNKARTTQNTFPVDIISFKFRGSIYDTEDLTKGLIDKKFKKIYFWDYYYNKAINLNLRVSCGDYWNYVKSKDATQNIGEIRNMSDSERYVEIGNLIKYICVDKLGAAVSDEVWDEGQRKTFYVSSPSTSIYDDINYLSKKYYDGDGFPCYFHYDRYAEEFRLMSYKTLFNSYRNQLKEIFHFNDPTNPTNGIIPPRSDKNNVFSIPSYGNILSYKYNKMSGADNIKNLNSIIVNEYDATRKKFITKSQSTHISNAKNIYGSMLNTFPEGNANPLFIINKDKIDNLTAMEIKSLEPTNAVNNILKPALLLNDALHFQVLGLPNRQPGSFIEIESDTDTEGIWEDRFLGTWLTVEVVHKISDSGYINDILAVKPNMSESFTYPDGTEL